jgi:hypothetical protein
MKMLSSTAIVAALVLALPACNQQGGASAEQAAATEAAGDVTALNGTWKVDLASLKFDGKPDSYVLKDSTYTCNTCIPPLTTTADGAYHPVADRPYYDSMAIKAVDDRTVEFRRKKGDREVSSSTLQVSEDGNTLNVKFHDATTPNAPPVDGTATSTRAGPAPAGAHAISGEWKADKIGDYTEEALNMSYEIDGDTVKQSSQGQSYTAVLGGPAVPVQGDIGGTMVAVAREGANGLKETYTRDGKEVGVVTIVPSADGKSFSFTNIDPRDGSTVTFTSNKTN